MPSKFDCESSGEVYEEMMALLKSEDSRYCSTRAVSSWSLYLVSIASYRKDRVI